MESSKELTGLQKVLEPWAAPLALGLFASEAIGPSGYLSYGQFGGGLLEVHLGKQTELSESNLKNFKFETFIFGKCRIM